jgi:hypothetical protein
VTEAERSLTTMGLQAGKGDVMRYKEKGAPLSTTLFEEAMEIPKSDEQHKQDLHTELSAEKKTEC